LRKTWRKGIDEEVFLVNENSIEEDIEILENFINWLKNDFEHDSVNEIEAIEHILSNYRKVLEENEELKQKWDKDTHKLQNALDIANADLYSANQIINEYIDDTIPIQKVKDEKEKLDKKYNELVDKVYKDPLKALTDFQRVVGGQAILNALLKEGET
jgi:type III secretory pathway component EscV